MNKIIYLLFAVFSLNTAFSQDAKEPDFTFQINYLNDSGELADKLESQVPKAKHAEFSHTYKFEVKGAKSSTRISDNTTPSFVVNMESNSKDIEGVIHIYKIESNKNKRKGQYKSKNPAGDKNYVQFDFERYGTKSYKLTVSQPLEKGEYMFVIWAEGARKVSLFGID